ncbi:MAG: hypothetical protein ABR905_05030 [Terracidiphilus sp.]
MNVSRAVSSHDWKNVFDPMWTAGYPALVALARNLAPQSAEGEWYAITGLNWILFFAEYASVRYLMKQAAALYDPIATKVARSPIVTWAVCSVFLSFGLCLDKVSRVAPDLLVSTLLILGGAQVLRTIRLRSANAAAILGLILGLGCWVKGVGLCNAAIMLLILLLARLAGKISWSAFAVSASVFLALLIPYVAGISWSYGQFTLGSSGELNYAFHVNHLPHWTNWQGGPPQFGSPIHTSEKLLNDLPAFAFPEPFTSTYPPYNNLSYWYRGFRHFFSLDNQVTAAMEGCYRLLEIVKDHQILWAFLAVVLAMTLRRDWRMAGLQSLAILWPLLLLPTLALLPYLMVHVEERYLGGILLLPALLPAAIALSPKFKARRGFIVFVFALYSAGAVAEFAGHDGETVQAAIGRRDFHSDPQWKLAETLSSHGFRSGDSIALIGRAGFNIRCGWAYITRVRVIAEFGSLPWNIEPWDRTRFDHAEPEEADKDWGSFFWQLPEQQREQVMSAFQGIGARAVISLAQPDSGSSGWIFLPGTGAWIYSFDPQLTASLATIQQAG